MTLEELLKKEQELLKREYKVNANVMANLD